MFLLLSFIDILSCLYWLLSATIFSTAEKIYLNYKVCHILSIFYLFIFTFDFTYLNCILYHFFKINANPIAGILHNFTILKYIIFSGVCGGLVTGVCAILNKFGMSVSIIWIYNM